MIGGNVGYTVYYGLAADRQEYCFTKDFLRTGGGPPGVLFYKSLFFISYGLAADRQEYYFTTKKNIYIYFF